MKGGKKQRRKKIFRKTSQGFIFANLPFPKFSRRFIFANQPLSNISRGFNFAKLSKIRENCKHLSSQKLVPLSIGAASLTTSTKETLLGILIDSELSFDQHVSFICTKASKKLHALGRIATFMSFEKRRTLKHLSSPSSIIVP